MYVSLSSLPPSFHSQLILFPHLLIVFFHPLPAMLQIFPSFTLPWPYFPFCPSFFLSSCFSFLLHLLTPFLLRPAILVLFPHSVPAAITSFLPSSLLLHSFLSYLLSFLPLPHVSSFISFPDFPPFPPSLLQLILFSFLYIFYISFSSFLPLLFFPPLLLPFLTFLASSS